MPDSVKCRRDIKSDDEWFSEVLKRGWPDMKGLIWMRVLHKNHNCVNHPCFVIKTLLMTFLQGLRMRSHNPTGNIRERRVSRWPSQFPTRWWWHCSQSTCESVSLHCWVLLLSISTRSFRCCSYNPSGVPWLPFMITCPPSLTTSGLSPSLPPSQPVEASLATLTIRLLACPVATHPARTGQPGLAHL